MKYVEDLFNDMISEEQNVKFRLVQAINTNKATLLEMCEELGLPMFEVSIVIDLHLLQG